MATGLQNYAEMKFEGAGSTSEAMKYIVLVCQVAGEVTGDEQLLALAEQLPNARI